MNNLDFLTHTQNWLINIPINSQFKIRLCCIAGFINNKIYYDGGGFVIICGLSEGIRGTG